MPIIDNDEISLCHHNPDWITVFQQEANKIRDCLGSHCLQVYHIGSTAVSGLLAKPIIDIVVVVNDLNDSVCPMVSLQNLNYIALGEHGIPGLPFFKKSTNAHCFHLQLLKKDHVEITRHLAFRDYLRQHPPVAHAYGAIKHGLAEQFRDDEEGYELGKNSFICTVHYWAKVAKQDQLMAKDRVILESFNPRWEKWAIAEIQAIKKIVNQSSYSIHHLGSTAISGMAAKPIIDLYIGLDDMRSAEDWIKPLQSLGYQYWDDGPNKNHQWYFKGMPPFGISRTHHVHIIPAGNKLNKRIQFKKQLQASARLRNDYLQLKSQLAHKYAQNHEEYTRQKSAFISHALENE
jgi:GrpB-like predicted nucleotidyltransferase (UPF0157 family)